MPKTDRHRQRAPMALDLLVTVTFNHNQLKAHLLPLLALDEVRSITLVSDEPGPDLPKLTTIVPAPMLRRVLGRAGAKFVVCLVVALRRRPDWIIGYNLVPHGATSSVVGRLAGVPSMYHMIGGPNEWEGGGWQSGNNLTGRLRRPSRRLEALLLRFARACSLIVTMGRRGRAELISRGMPEADVIVVPPAVDVSRFRRSAEPPRYDLVTVGRLAPEKRTADFLRAVAALRSELPEIKAAVVGVGPLEETLKAEADRLGLSDCVAFLGFRPDVESAYVASRIFVLPSSWEGLPVSLLESMSAGTVAVVSDVGEVRDVVTDGETGFLFPAGDVEALAAILSRLLADPELRERVSAAAAVRVREYAGVDAVSARYAEILGATAPRSSGRRSQRTTGATTGYAAAVDE
jgi:glycosyltransferase involved in cell wall biosynthesis